MILARLSTGSLSIGPVDFLHVQYFLITLYTVLEVGPRRDPEQGLYLKGKRTGPTEGASKGEVGRAMPPQVAPR